MDNIKGNNLIQKFKQFRMSGIFIVFILIIVIASIASPYFLTVYNLQSVIRSLAFVSIVAIGQACLLILGEIDLSVGAIAGLSGVLGGIMMVNASMNPYIAFVLSLLLGAGFGFINGFLVTTFNLNALIVTVGMTGVYQGINLVISKGKAIIGIPKEIYFLGQGTFFNIPMPFIIMLITLVIIVFITKFTIFGRYMYAIGNSKEASEILGIRVKRVRIATFMITGLLAALAGMLMVARLGSSQPSIGESWVMDSIASSVIGGVALTGGVGSPAGALLGAAIIAIVNNIIVLFGVSPYWQTAVSGAIVVAAVIIDSISRMVSKSGN